MQKGCPLFVRQKMARHFFNPFSLRQCKCLFISVLLVSAVVVLVALKWHPELVRVPTHPESSNDGQLESDQETQWTESVQFLPHTESPKSSEKPVVHSDDKTQQQQLLKKVLDSGPIYYPNQVPNNSPNSPMLRGNQQSNQQLILRRI